MKFLVQDSFWRQALGLHGSISLHVAPRVVVFGLIAAAVCGVAWLMEHWFEAEIGLEVAPFEIAGACLGLLLVLRTNAGYERWWEARKAWGGIVNQSRNIAISALAYGPADPKWREQMVRWTASFAHVARCSLRGEPLPPEVAELVGSEATREIAASVHMPSFIALKLAALLNQARAQFDMDGFAFVQLDRQRALLIDHVGTCERIMKSPLPRVYAITIRRFILLLLLTLPFALLHRIPGDWLIPFITMMVAYPLLSLDQIGVELQNPFAVLNLSHLPLEGIAATVQSDLHGLLGSGCE
jgi:putative membrane protein